MYAYTHSPLAKIWCANLKKARTLFLKQNFITDLTVLSQRTERINSYFNRIQTDRCCQIQALKSAFPIGVDTDFRVYNPMQVCGLVLKK